LEAAQTNEVQRPGDLVARRLDIPLSRCFERKGHVVEHGEMRPARGGLKKHADVSLIRNDENSLPTVEDSSTAQMNFTALRPLQPGHASQGRRFAAAGRSEKGKKLSLLDGKTDIIDGMNGSSAAHVELFDQILNVQHVNPFANIESMILRESVLSKSSAPAREILS